MPTQFHTVSMAAALDVIQAALDHKAISEQYLTELNIDAHMLQDPSVRIPETSLIDLWHALEEHPKCDGIGLKIGQIINPNAKGLLASWVSQTHTLRDALNTFIDNIALMNPSEHWQLKEQQNQCELTFELPQQKHYSHLAIERSMSAMITWARFLSGDQFHLQSACFHFSTPNYEPLFKHAFNCELHFNHTHNCLAFDAHLLDLPVISSNHLLKALIEQQALAALNAINTNKSIIEQVSQMIHQRLNAAEAISMDAICSLLAISRQTLYRELKKYDTDFQSIYDEIRKAEAMKLLKQDALKMESISLYLGFKDNSSFYKAFKRWHGMTPTQFKQQNG